MLEKISDNRYKLSNAYFSISEDVDIVNQNLYKNKLFIPKIYPTLDSDDFCIIGLIYTFDNNGNRIDSTLLKAIPENIVDKRMIEVYFGSLL